jgi:signal transduction histidine kinase
MFKSLRTGTKLLILCSIFIVTVGVTTYTLVVEKLIAIDFARKELVGNRYTTPVRELYAAILTGKSLEAGFFDDELLPHPSDAPQSVLGIDDQKKSLVAALHSLETGQFPGRDADAQLLDVLNKARILEARIGDESNLTLDPQLDTYYLQDIVVMKLPLYLGLLGELQIWVRKTIEVGPRTNQRSARSLALEGLLGSTSDRMGEDLAAAYRGNVDGSLRRAVSEPFALVVSSTSAYLNALSSRAASGEIQPSDRSYLNRLSTTAIGNTIDAWSAAQAELDQLLHVRINGLVTRLFESLAVTALLVALSLLVAAMTHRHIVRPLQRLERIANTVRETKNYDLRADITSDEEIGHLSQAFNSMLGELAATRKREISAQAELSRVSRLTAMGAMTASIAHEIKQPLAAIVANCNAGLRWLARPEPDVHEALKALQRIVGDGHRTEEVIESVRGLFRSDGYEISRVDVNGIITEVLAFLEIELQKQRILVESELANGLPSVAADRVKVQQVVSNLVMNAADAMREVPSRARMLRIKTESQNPPGVMVSIEDSGSGIEPQNVERIFEPFFTTKSNGTGMGLSICRSIIEAHGGCLWVSPGAKHGSVFHFSLPSNELTVTASSNNHLLPR